MKKLSSIQVVNILLFLALFVLFSVLYFFKETTELDKFSLPVLVICFEPKYKPSIYYGNNTADIEYHKIKEDQKRQKVALFLKSASYKLNEDIQIELRITDDSKTVKYDLEDGQKVMDNFQIDVYQTYTMSYGICYVIENTEKVSPLTYISVVLKDLNSENGDKLSKVNLFIAASETWYGIITNVWPYFELQEHSFSLSKPKTSHWIAKLKKKL
mgnify:FL=1